MLRFFFFHNKCVCMRNRIIVPAITDKLFALWARALALWARAFAMWARALALWARAFALWARAFALCARAYMMFQIITRAKATHCIY